MNGLMKSKTLQISIRCDPRKVFAFVSILENLPRWATAFVQSIKKLNGVWVAQTTQGPAKFKIAKKNSFGILDHIVIPAPGVEVYVPMRVVANGSESEVIFTLFQGPGMSSRQFAHDQKLVKKDLATLKRVLET